MTVVPGHPEVLMSKHWKAMKHIKPEVVEATKVLIKGKHWQDTPDDSLDACRTWVNTVSEAYEMAAPAVFYDPQVADAGGAYLADRHVILLPYFTVMTLLHEFRHAMQRKGANGARSATHENDAVEWSQSLFYAAAPRRFKRMVREGRIMYADPNVFGPPPTEDEDTTTPALEEES